jgi:DNA modification methylase
VKSDGTGILPDPERGPRQIYETCLLASRGDRKIVRAVANAYSAPTVRDTHMSEKPEPMLRHFFGMLVDENTIMLDPTCGSGSSLRAAESLGARRVLGLEINPEFAGLARNALERSRKLRKAEVMV